MVDKKKDNIHLLYLGIEMRENKYHDVWADVTGVENVGDPLSEIRDIAFDRTKDRIAEGLPGQIWSFDCTKIKGLVVYPSSATYLGMWLNQADIAKWQVAFNAVDGVIRMVAAQRKDSKLRFDLQYLQIYRDTYRHLPRDQQEMLLAQIIRYITQPSKKK